MKKLELLYKTREKVVNSIILQAIELFELLFPGRILSYYLLGSYIDCSWVEASDIDFAVIFKEKTTPQEAMIIEKIFNPYSKLLAKEIDLYVINEQDAKNKNSSNKNSLIFREGILNIKLSSKLLYGRDIVPIIPLPKIEDYTHITMQTPLHFMRKVRGYTDNLFLLEKLDYPNPYHKYFGYLENGDPLDSREVKTKILISLIGWICTALLALKAKQYIGKKSDFAKKYEQFINDPWTPFINKAYTLIRNDWNYVVPKRKLDQAELRKICQGILFFEKFFIDEYKTYIKHVS